MIKYKVLLSTNFNRTSYQISINEMLKVIKLLLNAEKLNKVDSYLKCKDSGLTYDINTYIIRTFFNKHNLDYFIAKNNINILSYSYDYVIDKLDKDILNSDDTQIIKYI